jgi:uncharacterized membrane protein
MSLVLLFIIYNIYLHMNRDKIVKINEMISKVKDKNILKEIFYLAQAELQSSGECKYSYNNNGIFFDLLNLSETTLLKIEEVIKSNQVTTDSENIKTLG